MTTRIIAIRHAKPLSAGYAEDAIRPLSDEGRIVQQEMTEKLVVKKYYPNRILTSPLLRAQQTAEIVAEHFGMSPEDEEALGFYFNGDILLSRIKKDETLVFVGHTPTLGEFVNALVGEMVLPGGLSKSGIAIVEFENEIDYGSGILIEYMKPYREGK